METQVDGRKISVTSEIVFIEMESFCASPAILPVVLLVICDIVLNYWTRQEISTRYRLSKRKELATEPTYQIHQISRPGKHLFSPGQNHLDLEQLRYQAVSGSLKPWRGGVD